MATPSTAASTLSWSSSFWTSTFVGPTSETSKLPEKKMPMLVLAQKKAKKTKKIILKEDVSDLGKKGQLVDVKAGYYRNFLLPMGKAQIVTPDLLNLISLRDVHEKEISAIFDQRALAFESPCEIHFGKLEMRMEEERIQAEKKRVKEEAQQLAIIFETVGAFKVKRKGGKGKQIFGSVTAQDLVDIIKAQIQRDVDKRIVSLPEIRETGEYIAELKLHPEVIARVRLNVYAN